VASGLAEGDAVDQILDDVAVQVDGEIVVAAGVEAEGRVAAGGGAVNAHDEDGAHLR